MKTIHLDFDVDDTFYTNNKLFFESYSIQQQLNTISLGLLINESAINTELDKRLSIHNTQWKNDIQSKANKEIDSIIAKNNYEIENLEQKIKILTNKNTDVELQYQQFKDNHFIEINNLKQSIRTEIQEINQIVLQEKDNRIQELKYQLDKINNASKNMKCKGDHGEEQLQSILSNYYPKAEFKDTHGKSHSGDIQMNDNGLNILFECKNYKNNVSQERVGFFLRDVDENDVNGGIMVSLNSGISHKDDLSFECREDNKYIVYLSLVNQNPEKIKWAVETIRSLCNCGTDLDTNKLDIVLDNFKDNIKRSSRIRKLINEQKIEIDTLERNNREMIIRFNTKKDPYDDLNKWYNTLTITYDKWYGIRRELYEQYKHWCSTNIIEIIKEEHFRMWLTSIEGAIISNGRFKKKDD